MSLSKKVTFHVKQLCNTLGVKNESDSSLDRLIDSLTSTYQEYRLEPKHSFKAEVQTALKDYITKLNENNKSDGQTFSTVMSLNQTLRSNYQNSTSKRQRPVDETVELKTAETATPSNSTKTTTTMAKKKKQTLTSNTSSGGGVSTNNNDSMYSTSYSNLIPLSRPSIRLKDLAGLDTMINQIKEAMFFPVLYPELYHHLGVKPMTGLLLQGPSGCGKSGLTYAIAGELNLPFFKVSGPELIGGASGESEERIRQVFDAAVSNAPSILFIDSLDVIAAKREASQRGMDRRVVAQLCDCIDTVTNMSSNIESERDGDEQQTSATNTASNVSQREENDRDSLNADTPHTPITKTKKAKNKYVLLIAATNKAETLDESVRGRFAKELSLPVPDKASRGRILKLMSSSLRLSAGVDFDELGRLTPGFVGSDLRALVNEAGCTAVTRIVNQYQQQLLLPANGLCSGHNVHSVGETETAVEDVVLFNDEDGKSIVTLDGKSNSNHLLLHHASIMECSPEQVIRKYIYDSVVRSRDGDGDSNDSAVSASISAAQLTTALSALKSNVTTQTSQDADNNLQTRGCDDDSNELLCCVEMADFVSACKCIQPSAKREGFAVVPDVTWDDVGALAAVREELFHNLLEPIAHPERFRSLGLEVPAGIIFYGPPGCGKTLLAKAVANQSGANFISVKGPELLNMYVGESESRVRQVFSRAKSSSPCVIFFDELDALCPKRGAAMDSGGGSGVSERVVNQLLTELDGLESRKDVYVIAATNRLELIDDAMLRPGRLGKLLYVPLPGPDDRVSILKALVRKVSINYSDGDPDRVDIDRIATDRRTDGFSGADISALVREAGLAVVKEWRQKDSTVSAINSNFNTVVNSEQHQSTSASVNDKDEHEQHYISMRHFEAALSTVRPSVSADDKLRYDKVNELLRGGMGAIQALKTAKQLYPNT